MQKVIFFGSDRYSATVLTSLLENRNTGGLEHIKVVTDQHHDPSPVEKIARTHDLEVIYYPSTPEEKIQFVSLLTSWFVDTLPTGLCASFDHLIPQDIIKLFSGNLYNLHPSLLPQYRNVSPVQYAIALGDKVTGITLFRISPGIDDGEIISQVSEPILEDDTTPTLSSRLFPLGAQLFVDALQNGFTPTAKLQNWDTAKLVFTRRLKRESGYIEWNVLHRLLKNGPVFAGESKNDLLNLRLNKIKSSGLIIDNWLLVIDDLLRSLSPWPTVWTTIPSKKGELRVSLESVLPEITLKIAGKPKAIHYSDFAKYYF